MADTRRYVPDHSSGWPNFCVGEWHAEAGNPPVPYFSLEFVDGGRFEEKVHGIPLSPHSSASSAVNEFSPKITDFGLAKQLHVGRAITLLRRSADQLRSVAGRGSRSRISVRLACKFRP